MTARLDTMQAAVLLAKLGIFDEEMALRQQATDRYQDRLSGSGVTIPVLDEGRHQAGPNMLSACPRAQTGKRCRTE